MKDYYIKTMSALLRDPKYGKECDELLKDLRETLKQHGHIKLLPSILRGVMRSLPAGTVNKPVLTVSTDDETEIEKQKLALKELKLTTEDTVVKIDPTIIGGFILEADGRLFDYSYKSQLVSLYRQIVRR